MGPQLFLPKTIAPWASSWVRAAPSDRAWVQVGAKRTPVKLVTTPPWVGNAPRVEGAALFVLNGTTASQRETLERDGISYVDPRGYLHFVGPSVLVHVERSQRVPRDAGPNTPVRLGPAAVRVAIACVLEPTELTITPLAKRAAASLAQTHETLRMLESAGFVRRSGRGPQTDRTLTDRSAVAELLRETVVRQRRPSSTPVFVYARRPEELWTRISTSLGADAVISGSAAAAVLSAAAAGPSSVPRTMVRVSQDVAIEDAIRRLEARPADSGANVILVVDKARWSDVLPRDVQHVRVANPVSVWLDCLREPRGEDVAQNFRESTLGF